MIDNSHDVYYPKGELFVRFDSNFREWAPTEDGLQLATDLVNDDAFPSSMAAIAERYGWPPRRLNPALNYLKNRNLIGTYSSIGQAPWAVSGIWKTDDTRRFVRSRTR